MIIWTNAMLINGLKQIFGGSPCTFSSPQWQWDMNTVHLMATRWLQERQSCDRALEEAWRRPGGGQEEARRRPPLAFAHEIWYRNMCHVFHFPTGVQQNSATLEPLVHRCTASLPLLPGRTLAGDLWGFPKLAGRTSTAHPLNSVAWRRGGPWLHPVPWWAGPGSEETESRSVLSEMFLNGIYERWGCVWTFCVSV